VRGKSLSSAPSGVTALQGIAEVFHEALEHTFWRGVPGDPGASSSDPHGGLTGGNFVARDEVH